MFPITSEKLQQLLDELEIIDITTATIRQICSIADAMEEATGEKVVHLEIGNPGLPAESIGIEAECAALRGGCANKYPNIAGLPQLKSAARDFLKAFLNVDMAPLGIIPTVGSMQGTFSIYTLLKFLSDKKDTILFLDPGFPAQHHQAKLVGIKQTGFDIYEYRGKKLEAKLESYFQQGNIVAMIYGNPNNPAWTNLTHEELEIIGRLATKYDVIVIEDMAYLGMDFRQDFSHPNEAPYIPSVAHYTDNYILLVSGSKIFSYAGQRIACVCMSDKVYQRPYETLEKFFEMPRFGDAYVFGVLYCSSSGTSHSAQYALAAMMEAAVKGELDFVAHSREYGRRAGIIKKLLDDTGFHIVYSKDGEAPISDGFFFTAGYGDMTSEELQRELMRYGIASISLPSTGSKQNGVRICVSMISDQDTFDLLGSRLKDFDAANRHRRG